MIGCLHGRLSQTRPQLASDEVALQVSLARAHMGLPPTRLATLTVIHHMSHHADCQVDLALIPQLQTHLHTSISKASLHQAVVVAL